MNLLLSCIAKLISTAGDAFYQSDNSFLSSFRCMKDETNEEILFKIKFTKNVNCGKIELIHLDPNVLSENTKSIPLSLKNCSYYKTNNLHLLNYLKLIKNLDEPICCDQSRKIWRLVFSKHGDLAIMQQKFWYQLKEKMVESQETIFPKLIEIISTDEFYLKINRDVLTTNTFYLVHIYVNVIDNLNIEGNFIVQSPLLYYNGIKTTIISQDINLGIVKVVDKKDEETVLKSYTYDLEPNQISKTTLIEKVKKQERPEKFNYRFISLEIDKIGKGKSNDKIEIPSKKSIFKHELITSLINIQKVKLIKLLLILIATNMIIFFTIFKLSKIQS